MTRDELVTLAKRAQTETLNEDAMRVIIPKLAAGVVGLVGWLQRAGDEVNFLQSECAKVETWHIDDHQRVEELEYRLEQAEKALHMAEIAWLNLHGDITADGMVAECEKYGFGDAYWSNQTFDDLAVKLRRAYFNGAK